MSRKKGNIANYTSIIATVATAILAITALITVYITLSAWREEREANRPYFTFYDSPAVVFNSESPQFEIKFTNVGEHPAVDLWSKSLVFNTNLKEKPIAEDEYALVNDIPKNASATLMIGLGQIEKQAHEGNVEPQFIVIVLRYQDPIINEKFEQTLYVRWNGMQKGKVLPTTHAEEEEKKIILQYFERIRFNGVSIPE
ncbi:MAG: hypothetical protein AWM53_01197 [Candidatus Dichloromethanomonas elyunquensis]|nr:MAG: hypothetical protein AWM53_01197 [Candidatus Dichloromethanomonas elyunquensis]